MTATPNPYVRPEPRLDAEVRCEKSVSSSGSYRSHPCGRPAAFAFVQRRHGEDVVRPEGLCKLHAAAIWRSAYQSDTTVRYLDDEAIAAIRERVEAARKLAREMREREAERARERIASAVERDWLAYPKSYTTTLLVETSRWEGSPPHVEVRVHRVDESDEGWNAYSMRLDETDHGEPATIRIGGSGSMTPNAAAEYAAALAYLAEVVRDLNAGSWQSGGDA